MNEIQTEIHRQVEACEKGDFERLIGRCRSGFVIMGASQILKGYCLLLPSTVPAHLNQMPMDERTLFLQEMSLIGESILKVVQGVRINYEMLGNLQPALHAHIIPRFADEPEDLRALPYWNFPQELVSRYNFDPEKHRCLMDKIHHQLMTDGVIS